MDTLAELDLHRAIAEITTVEVVPAPAAPSRLTDAVNLMRYGDAVLAQANTQVADAEHAATAVQTEIAADKTGYATDPHALTDLLSGDGSQRIAVLQDWHARQESADAVRMDAERADVAAQIESRKAMTAAKQKALGALAHKGAYIVNHS
jgi:hypothetical protein